MRRTRRLTGALLGAVLLGAVGCGGGEGRPVADGPNLVLITSDDQAMDSFTREAMPKTMDLLVDEGTVPDDFVVTTPLCCPSRASMLTGQYGHNNGVLANRYRDLRNPGSTLPVWLRDAGYTTVHIGKYLNGYEKVSKKVRPAPGWDGWATAVSADYFDYPLYGADGPKQFGSKPEDYLTRVLTRRATQAISDAASDERPLFLQVDYYAPHPDPSDDQRCGDSATPDPRDTGLFTDATAPRPPSFNERDLSDKPAFMRSGRIDADGIARIDRRLGCQLASLRALDRGIGEIVGALEEAGELEDTAIFFLSDNGVLRGQHRLSGGKHVAYEEAISVPAAMRIGSQVLDGAEAPPELPGPTANIDIAPTFLDLAGAEPCTADGDCRVLDGRSLVGALTGAEPLDPDRTLVIEIDEEANPERIIGRPCEFRGVRDGSVFFIRYLEVQSRTSGECEASDASELYDLDEDPFQLENLLPPGGASPAAERLAAEQAELLERLRDCRGIAGRDPEPPDGISYCE